MAEATTEVKANPLAELSKDALLALLAEREKELGQSKAMAAEATKREAESKAREERREAEIKAREERQALGIEASKGKPGYLGLFGFGKSPLPARQAGGPDRIEAYLTIEAKVGGFIVDHMEVNPNGAVFPHASSGRSGERTLTGVSRAFAALIKKEIGDAVTLDKLLGKTFVLSEEEFKAALVNPTVDDTTGTKPDGLPDKVNPALSTVNPFAAAVLNKALNDKPVEQPAKPAEQAPIAVEVKPVVQGPKQLVSADKKDKKGTPTV